MGEELGLEDAVVPPDRAVDPVGRDRCRAPMPWTRATPHGWDGQPPWLPFPPEPDVRSVEAERQDNTSVLSLYRSLLRLRRASPALRLGDLHRIDATDGVLGFERRHADDVRLVLVNFLDEPVAVTTDEPYDVELCSDGTGEQQPYPGSVAAESAVILRPSAVTP